MGDRLFTSIDYFQNGASDFDEILYNANIGQDTTESFDIRKIMFPKIRPLLAILFSGFYLVFGDFFSETKHRNSTKWYHIALVDRE